MTVITITRHARIKCKQLDDRHECTKSEYTRPEKGKAFEFLSFFTRSRLAMIAVHVLQAIPTMIRIHIPDFTRTN